MGVGTYVGDLIKLKCFLQRKSVAYQSTRTDTMARRSARIQRRNENKMAAYWGTQVKLEHQAAKRKATLVLELIYRDVQLPLPPCIKMAHKAAREKGQQERLASHMEYEVIIE